MSDTPKKIDFTVSVFIVHDDKVLLRFHEKYHLWLGVGGHVEPTEEPNQAALREVKEEVGIDATLMEVRAMEKAVYDRPTVRELIPPVYMNIHKTVNDLDHRHIDMIYFARSETDNVVPEKETDAWKWLSAKELDENASTIPADILLYAKAALTAAKENIQ